MSGPDLLNTPSNLHNNRYYIWSALDRKIHLDDVILPPGCSASSHVRCSHSLSTHPKCMCYSGSYKTTEKTSVTAGKIFDVVLATLKPSVSGTESGGKLR